MPRVDVILTRQQIEFLHSEGHHMKICTTQQTTGGFNIMIRPLAHPSLPSPEILWLDPEGRKIPDDE